MKLVLLATVFLLAGCDLARFYFNETSGMSPGELIPLFFQEREYAEDQRLIAKVKGALAAEPELRGAEIIVDAYKKDVTLKGASPAQREKTLAVARAVPGVKSAELK